MGRLLYIYHYVINEQFSQSSLLHNNTPRLIIWTQWRVSRKSQTSVFSAIFLVLLNIVQNVVRILWNWLFSKFDSKIYMNHVETFTCKHSLVAQSWLHESSNFRHQLESQLLLNWKWRHGILFCIISRFLFTYSIIFRQNIHAATITGKVK